MCVCVRACSVLVLSSMEKETQDINHMQIHKYTLQVIYKDSNNVVLLLRRTISHTSCGSEDTANKRGKFWRRLGSELRWCFCTLSVSFLQLSRYINIPVMPQVTEVRHSDEVSLRFQRFWLSGVAEPFLCTAWQPLQICIPLQRT